VNRRTLAAALLLLLAVPGAALAAAKAAHAPGPAPTPAPVLKVGVTLHPYYSWAKSVVGDTPVEVRAILPDDVDSGNYQPSPGDIKKLADLDAIVVNGVGHDDFIFDMIKASGNTKIVLIKPNDGLPLLKAKNGGVTNAHTFISFTNAIQGTWTIEKALAGMKPELAPAFEENAAAYARKLRTMKAAAATKLADAKINRVITVHDGYGYLMQEFGIDIAAVVEPSHGITPSAAELQQIVEIANKQNVHVVFAEESFPKPMLDSLKESAHAKVYVISHIEGGGYTAETFEKAMQENVDSMIRALVTDPGRT